MDLLKTHQTAIKQTAQIGDEKSSFANLIAAVTAQINTASEGAEKKLRSRLIRCPQLSQTI